MAIEEKLLMQFNSQNSKGLQEQLNEDSFLFRNTTSLFNPDNEGPDLARDRVLAGDRLHVGGDGRQNGNSVSPLKNAPP